MVYKISKRFQLNLTAFWSLCAQKMNLDVAYKSKRNLNSSSIAVCYHSQRLEVENHGNVYTNFTFPVSKSFIFLC